MAELKYGGKDVKIMYGDREIGGATKLEPGTILYLAEGLQGGGNFKGAHLKSTTKDWSNIDGIHLQVYYGDLSSKPIDNRIYSDDFKSLDAGKKYDMSKYISMTVSRSIINGEYRLNASAEDSYNIFVVSAL